MQARTWKLLGIAGVAGVTATGVAVARRRRAHQDYQPDELRAKLHARLAEVPRPEHAGTPAAPGAEPPPAEPPVP